MDPHAFTAPTRVRVLLVPLASNAPIGSPTGSPPTGSPTTNASFHRLAQRLMEAQEVRLVDVTPTQSGKFNPQGFPRGSVHYDFSTAIDNQESLFLHDFEPFRKTFVVVGIADSHYEGIEEDLVVLKKIHKSPIVHCAVVFGDDPHPNTTTTNMNIFYCTKQNSPETVMCDVTRLFLDDLTAYLSSYQHITLRSPGQLGSNDRAKPLPPAKSKRISSGASMGLSLNSDISSTKISFKTANERRHARLKGRQLKILGNLLLLAGKYTDAFKEFVESIVQLKAGNDHLWIGSALEGINVCLFMISHIGMSYQIPHSLANVIVTSTTFPSLMSPSPTPITSPRNSTVTVSNGITSTVTSANPSPTTSSKQSAELECMPIHDLLLKIFERVISYYEYSQTDPEDYVPNLVYCESILRFLKFMTILNIGGGLTDQVQTHIITGKPFTRLNRNDTFDKSEIFKLSQKLMSIQLKNMDILSQTRIYTSLASIYGDLGFDRKKSFMLRTLFVSLIPQLNSNNNGIHPANAPSPTYDLQDVINTVLSVYGIALCTESDIKDAFSSKWMQLQKSIIKLCISVCEEIHDFNTVISLKSLLLTRYLDSLTANEQQRIFNEIQEIRRQYCLDVSYLDPFILRGVHLLRPSNPPKKLKKQKITAHKDHHVDPLIYNPFKKTEVLEKNYIVQEEFTEFLLVLQNPFSFPLIIQDIKIENFEILRTHFTIPSKSLHKINILTKPQTPGHHVIESIYLKINDCLPQWFKIVKSQKPKSLRKLKEKPIEAQVSNIIKSYISNIQTNNITPRVDTDSLALEIIPLQPSLQVLNAPEPLMLLEGGKHLLKINLKNNSSVSVNFLEFAIWDNTIDPLKQRLENKDLLADEVHEIEYFLYKQSLEILSDVEEIKPFEEVELELEVQGKRGVNKINLILEYGFSLNENDVFTRSLEIPITAIVHSSTDLADCNVIPLHQEIDEGSEEIWKFIKQHGEPISQWCLFVVDFRNLWNKALLVEIGCEGFKSHESIVPMETKRLILPIKRIDLDYENMKPIPSLSGKQYIVPKISRAEDQHQREAFWYRERILQLVKGTWSVGGVTGDLELRAIRLSQKMLNVLKMDKVSIDINIKDGVINGTYHEVKTGEFITVDVKVTNHTSRILKGIIRNIPTASNYGVIDRRLLFNGMLQQKFPQSLEPGESLTLPIGAVVLERGEYEWAVMIDELENDSQHICRSPLRIKAF